MDVVRVYFLCSNCVFFYCFFGPLPKDDAGGRPLSSVPPSLNPAASRPPRFPPPRPEELLPQRRDGREAAEFSRDVTQRTLGRKSTDFVARPKKTAPRLVSIGRAENL